MAAWLAAWLGTAAAAPARKPVVVATVSDLGAIARAVGAERAVVHVLLPDGQDPLRATPQPEQVLLLDRADLLLRVGGLLEQSWLPPLLAATRNAAVREALEVRRLLPEEAGYYPLADPRAAPPVARALAEALGGLDPAGAAGYQRAAAALEAELARRQRAWRLQLAPLRMSQVVAHDVSFAPFLAWAGVRSDVVLAPRPGELPSALRMLQVLRTLRAGPAPRLVLQHDYDPPQLGRLLRDRGGAQLVVVPLGARTARGEGYLEGMERLVQAVAGALAAAQKEPRR
ncbi:MAG: zinc ABC transporter substrate-binding protein [Myxococcales bacterium]|nr:zinc ABC transporter substrate-binding protein [Myxococcota bacterium]MDW8280297.1 zinc ABC transporter substrate-binding protein [Myxococcales bacterium]